MGKQKAFFVGLMFLCGFGLISLDGQGGLQEVPTQIASELIGGNACGTYKSTSCGGAGTIGCTITSCYGSGSVKSKPSGSVSCGGGNCAGGSIVEGIYSLGCGGSGGPMA